MNAPAAGSFALETPGLRVRVVGSGPVSQAFALFALRQGFSPAQVAIERDAAPRSAALANRLIAISLGSWQLLARIARASDAAPIATVDVSVAGLPGRVRIRADEMRVPALGYVVRYGALLAALDEALAAAGWPRDAARADPGRDDDRDEDAEDGADLVVHAEGDAGGDADERVFEQAALLAEVAIGADGARRHPGTAFECFTADGPLALLPTPGTRRYALVWCASPEATHRRVGLPREALDAELQATFGWSLGALSIATEPVVAALTRRARREPVAGSEAWIGNAAQTLHPVAGQGLNLGIRDAFELARCLGDAARDDAAPPGARDAAVGRALERYRGARSRDRAATILLTDALASGFSIAPLRPLQSAALVALDTIPLARARLARRFMFGFR